MTLKQEARVMEPEVVSGKLVSKGLTAIYTIHEARYVKDKINFSKI